MAIFAKNLKRLCNGRICLEVKCLFRKIAKISQRNNHLEYSFSKVVGLSKFVVKLQTTVDVLLGNF